MDDQFRTFESGISDYQDATDFAADFVSAEDSDNQKIGGSNSHLSSSAMSSTDDYFDAFADVTTGDGAQVSDASGEAGLCRGSGGEVVDNAIDDLVYNNEPASMESEEVDLFGVVNSTSPEIQTPADGMDASEADDNFGSFITTSDDDFGAFGVAAPETTLSLDEAASSNVLPIETNNDADESEVQLVDDILVVEGVQTPDDATQFDTDNTGNAAFATESEQVGITSSSSGVDDDAMGDFSDFAVADNDQQNETATTGFQFDDVSTEHADIQTSTDELAETEEDGFGGFESTTDGIVITSGDVFEGGDNLQPEEGKGLETSDKDNTPAVDDTATGFGAFNAVTETATSDGVFGVLPYAVEQVYVSQGDADFEPDPSVPARERKIALPEPDQTESVPEPGGVLDLSIGNEYGAETGISETEIVGDDFGGFNSNLLTAEPVFDSGGAAETTELTFEPQVELPVLTEVVSDSMITLTTTENDKLEDLSSPEIEVVSDRGLATGIVTETEPTTDLKKDASQPDTDLLEVKPKSELDAIVNSCSPFGEAEQPLTIDALETGANEDDFADEDINDNAPMLVPSVVKPGDAINIHTKQDLPAQVDRLVSENEATTEIDPPADSDDDFNAFTSFVQPIVDENTSKPQPEDKEPQMATSEDDAAIVVADNDVKTNKGGFEDDGIASFETAPTVDDDRTPQIEKSEGGGFGADTFVSFEVAAAVEDQKTSQTGDSDKEAVKDDGFVASFETALADGEMASQAEGNGGEEVVVEEDAFVSFEASPAVVEDQATQLATPEKDDAFQDGFASFDAAPAVIDEKTIQTSGDSEVVEDDEFASFEAAPAIGVEVPQSKSNEEYEGEEDAFATFEAVSPAAVEDQPKQPTNDISFDDDGFASFEAAPTVVEEPPAVESSGNGRDAAFDDDFGGFASFEEAAGVDVAPQEQPTNAEDDDFGDFEAFEDAAETAVEEKTAPVEAEEKVLEAISTPALPALSESVAVMFQTVFETADPIALDFEEDACTSLPFDVPLSSVMVRSSCLSMQC